MSQIKVTTSFKTPDFTGFVDSNLLRDMQASVVEQNIKADITAGNSPVSGYGRYVGYKDPEKYPGGRKGSRPVNLTLSGDLLDSYVAEKGSDSTTVNLGISRSASPDVKARAEGNNYGTAKGVAVRRFIPGPGETFKQATLRAIKDAFNRRLRSLILQGKI